MEILAPVIVILFIVGIVFMIRDGSYNTRSHSVVSESAKLRANAKIIDVKSERVGRKDTTAIRTTVSFDDGFTYISHDSDKEFHLASYTLSLSKETMNKILHDAVAAHQAALSGK